MPAAVIPTPIPRPVSPADEQRALAEARASRLRFVRELEAFVRFPSVAAQTRHHADTRRCAAWLRGHLDELGLDARLIRTPGQPLVIAGWKRAPDRPTVLIYGHYDVQPAEPLKAWTSPPFEPTVRGDNLFGRGASDDKGQLWVHVKALDACLRATGRLPVNVICIFEGEEESGSTHLLRFLSRQRTRLAADVALLSDMRMRSARVPSVTYGLRGSTSLEVTVRGPARDLHSGLFGGTVHNPIQALAEILAQLHDSAGRVAVPGFYRAVRRNAPAERATRRRDAPDDDEVLRAAGIRRGWGERGFSLYERTTIRPALAITGITGGYTGEGAKSVIPARATARLNIRLVPDQDPAEIATLFRRHIAALAPDTVSVEVRGGAGARPALVDPRNRFITLATRALERSFGRRPALLRSGGTIPVVSALDEELGLPVIALGFAQPDDGAHAPNEKFHLPVLFRGVEASIRFLHDVGRSSPGSHRIRGRRA